MARRAHVPAQLRSGPFTIAEAREAGLTQKQLEGDEWRHLRRGVYCWAGLAQTPMLELQAVHRTLPLPAAFGGRTAAWLHGLDLRPCDPVDIVLDFRCGPSARTGMSVRRAALPPGDIVSRHGLPATTVVRTLFDLASQLSITEAVVVADSALQKRLVTPRELGARAELATGAKGVRRYRKVVELADPGAESPMETRLRLLLVLNGLPKPQTQVELRGPHGTILGRTDLYYPDHRLAIEFDGAVHRDTLEYDDRRQNDILNAGYRMLRFTGGEVLRRPETVLATVRAALTHQAKRAA